MARVLILCPTFDHADTLFASTGSARAQRFADWEMVVIGDGAPERTAQVMAQICAADARVRYEWRPKSARYGEIHRDPVIRESNAEFVFQLSDDDLWAPDHIDTMLPLLERAEWVNQAPLRVAPTGEMEWWPINHGTAGIRASITAGIPVSAGPNFVAYRREAYLRLAEGWTCAPPTSPSDAFMWAKFFRMPDLSVASTAATSAIKFPSTMATRKGRSPEQRMAELSPWLAKIAAPGLTDRLRAKARVRARMLSLFMLHDGGLAASWREAAEMAGLRPMPVDAPTVPAFNGMPMATPLSEAQCQNAEDAWLVMRAYDPRSTDIADARAQLASRYGTALDQWIEDLGWFAHAAPAPIARGLVSHLRALFPSERQMHKFLAELPVRGG